MRKIEPRLFWGGLFIMVGALFLAQNLGMLILKDPFWLMVFLFSGSYMLLISFQSKAQWWALIPGFTLLSLAIMIAVNGFMPSSRAAWSSSIILGGIGVGFLGVYLRERLHWWAIIPGGVLVTLALVAGINPIKPGIEPAGIFFLGLGLTFAFIATLPRTDGSMNWAWTPSGVLLLTAAAFLLGGGSLAGILWPIVLILLGAYFIFRVAIKR